MPGAHYRRKLCDDCRKARLAKRTAANAAKRLEERQAERADVQALPQDFPSFTRRPTVLHRRVPAS
jgi:hypothetical protein